MTISNLSDLSDCTDLSETKSESRKPIRKLYHYQPAKTLWTFLLSENRAIRKQKGFLHHLSWAYGPFCFLLSDPPLKRGRDIKNLSPLTWVVGP